MFAQLLDSRPVRRRSPAGFAASLLLHGIIVAGAIVTTSRATGPRPSYEEHVVMEYRAPMPEPRRESPALRKAWTPLAVDPGIVGVSVDVPDFIPPFNPLRAFINTDEPLEFRLGPSRPGTPGPGLPASPGVLFVDQVEIPVVLDGRSPLPSFPRLLKNAGVEGMARLSFVVDTLGRVEPGTATVMESTHPAFALAVQAALPRLRFAPARVGGRAVRQLVEFPVQFHLAK